MPNCRVCGELRLLLRNTGACRDCVAVAIQQFAEADDEPPNPTYYVECPDCEEVIAIPIVVELHGGHGGQTMTCEPDLADLWAHSWTHRAAS